MQARFKFKRQRGSRVGTSDANEADDGPDQEPSQDDDEDEPIGSMVLGGGNSPERGQLKPMSPESSGSPFSCRTRQRVELDSISASDSDTYCAPTAGYQRRPLGGGALSPSQAQPMAALETDEGERDSLSRVPLSEAARAAPWSAAAAANRAPQFAGELERDQEQEKARARLRATPKSTAPSTPISASASTSISAQRAANERRQRESPSEAEQAHKQLPWLPTRSTSELGFFRDKQEPISPQLDSSRLNYLCQKLLEPAGLASQSECQINSTGAIECSAGCQGPGRVGNCSCASCYRHTISGRRRSRKRFYSEQLHRPLSINSLIFSYYTKQFAREKFYLALKAFKRWYHEQLTYNHLSKRMEFNQYLFDRWYKSKGKPLSLRSLDRFDQIVIWIAGERDSIQKKTFTKWINKYLNKRGIQMADLFEDLRDGQNLILLLEMLSGQKLPREKGRMRVHQLQNIQIALNYIKLRKVRLVNIRPEDIVDGNRKLILGLIWTIILHFQLEDNTNPDDLPEAKLRMKMEALKRRLEELEYRIDNMGPIAKDLDGIQRQLAELRDFDEDLNKCRTDLNEFVNLAEEYIKEDLIADPVALRRDIQALKDQFARIEDKAAKRLKMFEKALKHAEDQKRAEAEMEMKLNQLKKLLDELERRLDNMAPVGKDLATLQKQLAEMKDFENDLGEARRLLSDTKRLAEDFISNDLITDPDGLRRKLKGLEKQLACIEDKANERLRAIQDALNRAKAQRSAEQQFQLRLDDMKRELDELERRLDNMAPVSRDLNTLQQQLAEMNDFNQKLNGARRNLNELNKAGEDLIREGLISDPASLRASLKSLKEQLIRIEDKAARRMRDIQDALNHAENQKKAEAKIQLKLEQLKKLLDELERRLDNMAPVGKDLATLQKQLIEMREFETDLGNARRLLNETKRLAEDMISSNLISDPDLLRRQVKSLEEQLARIEEKANLRMKAIQDALKRAEAQRAAEAKFQLRLDDMKRELDEMERKLDNMGPIAKDLPGLQAQLAEINDFSQKLNGTRRNLNDLNKAGEDLIREDLIADPIALRAALKALKDQLARIEEKAAKRLRDIQDAMSRVAASDAIQDVKNWLERARKVLVDEENVFGDLDTVNALIEQHISFQEELAAHQPTMNEVKRMELELSNSSPKNGAIIRNEMSDLMQKWKEVENLTREKTSKLDEALRVAQQMHQSVGQLLEWLAEAEMKLRFAGSLPDDEQATKLELQEHEKFMRKLQSQCEQKDSILKLAKEILNKCHPDAEPVIKLNTNIIESRWEDIEAWAKQRGQRLNDHLRNLLDILELVEELSAWLSRHENRLLAEESEPLPDNGRLLEQLIDQHSGFMDELRKRELDVDRVIKIFASKSGSSTSKMILTTTTIKPAGSSSSLAGRSPLDSGKGSSSSGRLSANRSTTPTRTSYATYRDEYPDIRQPKARLMLDKWRSVWQLSVDKMQRLKDRVEHFKEIERLENFDFDEWRRRFITWVNAKKGRVMDFYRSIDDDNDGRISIDSFINGVLKSKFESSRLEMERVCEIIDKNNDGVIDNKEYLDSLRPDKPITDDEIIQDEVQRQVTKCTCSQRFKVYHVGEGRYRFGESQKLRLVRILRSTVMVRVGGGWEPLISFLQKNDPCRAKGRTNIELREQFILPEGASQAMAAFRSKMSPSR